MKQIAVIDSETDPFKKGRVPAPFIWGFYDGNNYEVFYNEIDLIAFLEDKPIIVYAHNGGKFDYHFLLDFIEPFTKVKIINGRISKFKIGKCEFRDSYNILPTSLAAYQKTEISYDIFEPEERDKPKNKKTISNYLYDDCIFLYNYVMDFINCYGLSLTQAGAALQQWEQISGLKAPEDFGGETYEKFIKYYYGGRTQSFEYGVIEDDFSMVDINSAYPYAMLSKHPLYNDHYEINGDDWLAMEKEARGPCFLTIRCASGGGLPYRGPDNSLFFPDDYIDRVYNITGWELMGAIETETIRDWEILEGYTFTHQTDFKDYIQHFYDARKEAKANGDKSGDIFCKLLMNSLYGKFGSNPYDYHNFQVANPTHLDEEGKLNIERSNGTFETWDFSGEFGPWALTQRDLNDEEKRFYNVATAASITGFVRAFLWRAICQCDGVLYCDTDSIAARRIGNFDTGFGRELGQWDLEGEFNQGVFCGRKLYAMRYKGGSDTTKAQFKVQSQGIGFCDADIESGKKGRGPYRYESEQMYKVACKGVRLSAEEIKQIGDGETILFEPENPIFSVHKAPHFQNRRVRMVKKVLPETA